MSVADQFEQMLQRFNPAASGTLDAIFQYQIEEAKAYHLIVKECHCTLAAGVHDAPTVCLTLSEETLADIMSGETDGMQAFMSGQLKATGDLMLATRLPELFPTN